MIYIVVIIIAGVLWYLLVRWAKNKELSPSTLRKHWKNYIDIFEQTELSFAFKSLGVIGQDLIYKEHTDSRDLRFIIKNTKTNTDYLQLVLVDKNGNVIWRSERSASGFDEDDKCMNNIFELYVNEFKETN